MTNWGIAIAAVAVLLTIALFVLGAVYPRPTVIRVQDAHDAEMRRLIQDHAERIAEIQQNSDYWRDSALSCSSAVAHREAQVYALKAQLHAVQEQLDEYRRRS